MRLEGELHERRPRQLEQWHDREHLEVVERDGEGARARVRVRVRVRVRALFLTTTLMLAWK